MARQVTTGFEVNEGATKASASVEPTLGSGAVAATIQTSVVRSGVYAGACTSSTTTSFVRTIGVTAFASTTLFLRGYLCFSALPTASPVAVAGQDGTLGYSARLTSGGKLQLWTGAQQGSDSAATIVADSATWYRIELGYTINGSTQITDIELRLDGVTVATVSGLTLTVGQHSWGWLQAPSLAAVNVSCYVDDIAANDSTGAAQNSWPGSGKVVMLKPISLNTNGGSWTDDAAATTSAALTNAVDNTPPLGIADTAAGGGNHQVRNAAANSSLDMNLTTYSTAGIAAADTINVVKPIISPSAPASTGAKSGSVGISSNPVIANAAFTGGSGTAAFFWGGTAAGTFPTGWRWEYGTTTYAPAVTVGSSPVMRVTITAGTTTRIADVCAMGLTVDYTPSASVTPPRTVTVVSQAVNRAASW